MQNPHLEIKNLRKVYDRDLFKKKAVVIDELNCRFLEGQCTALMGHNGAGKTTTIRMIFGLINSDSGEILYRGKPLKTEDKRLIGYMPETNKLALNLTCEEILLHHLRVFRPAHLKPKDYGRAIEEKLKEIELWDHRKKRVGKLSKGMGRRLSWAQATLHKPELIILDEPMSGLDPLGYRLMVNLINKLREEKVTIILCTHELWSIEQLCDHVHILNHGRLVFSTLDLNEKDEHIAHLLVISGGNQKEIEHWAAEAQLPKPSEIRSNKHRIEILLSNYQEASRWLDFAQKKGLVIVNFQKVSQLSESRLIAYFGEEKTA